MFTLACWHTSCQLVLEADEYFISVASVVTQIPLLWWLWIYLALVYIQYSVWIYSTVSDMAVAAIVSAA